MQIETWRVWSDPTYMRRVLSEIRLQKGRAQDAPSASYQVRRLQPVRDAPE